MSSNPFPLSSDHGSRQSWLRKSPLKIRAKASNQFLDVYLLPIYNEFMQPSYRAALPISGADNIAVLQI